MSSKSIWLFHFRLVGEKNGNPAENAHGLGHALRCLTLIHQLSSQNISSLIVINKSSEGREFISSKGFEPLYEEELESILKNNSIEVIISDINYLEDRFIDIYEKFSTWVSLAPRGQTKYRSSLAFKDTFFDDVPPLSRAKNNKILSGADYVVTRPEFELARQKLLNNEIIKNSKKIIISMGGTDHLNLTSSILKLLSDLDSYWKIEAIVGPLNDHYEELKSQVVNYNPKISIVKNPKDIYLNIAESNFGIFAAGLSSYESIGLGTPCMNINLSDFHSKRSKELVKLGVGIDLGRISSLSKSVLKSKIKQLSNDLDMIASMRRKGRSLIDGKGSTRIISEIQNHLIR